MTVFTFGAAADYTEGIFWQIEKLNTRSTVFTPAIASVTVIALNNPMVYV